MSKEYKPSIGRDILIAVVSATSVVLIQQLFLPYNIGLEQRKEIVVKNFEHINRIKNFARIAHYAEIEYPTSSVNLKIRNYVDEKTRRHLWTDTLRTEVEDTIRIVIPLIAIESVEQQKWKRECKEIQDNKEFVNSLSYRGFQKIIEIVNNNPWPFDDELETLENSIWTNDEFVKEWELVNMNLYYICEETTGL